MIRSDCLQFFISACMVCSWLLCLIGPNLYDMLSPRFLVLKSCILCRHLSKNFLIVIRKYSFRQEATNELLKQIFNQIAYALSAMEYGIAIDELKKFKHKLAI